MLFLLDELLHGTNSHDRRVGAEAILRGLVDRGAIGLVTTHDLALAEMAAPLGPRAANVHFEDELEDGKMRFDYRMRPGVVQKSNALALMRAVGLDVVTSAGMPHGNDRGTDIALRGAMGVVMRASCLLGVVLALTGAACGRSSVCENGTAPGSVWISNDDDLRAMVGCTRLKGHLVIERLSSSSLAGLDSLTTIDGKLIIGPNDGLEDISALASLTSVGGGNVLGGGQINVAGNPMLATVRFPALTSLAGQLSLGGAGLTTIDFPALTSTRAACSSATRPRSPASPDWRP